VACQLQERRPEYQALAKRVAARRSGADITGKPVSKRARNRAGTAVLEADGETEVDVEGLTGEPSDERIVPGTGAVTQTGPRQQPKRNQTRSQRKKR
jgi:hypothetical protein